MNKIKRIIEIKKERLLLEKLRNVLLDLNNNSYYNNGANVRALIPLQKYKYDTDKKAFHIVNMSIYYNDMIKFNNFWLSFTGKEESISMHRNNNVLSKRK